MEAGYPMSVHFPAAYAGRCRSCGTVFEPGTEVFYGRGEDTVTVWECCGDDDGRALTQAERIPLGRVLPHGKSKRDMCGRCFQIPASNGACGCDS